MLCQRLQRIGGKIVAARLFGQQIATQQIVELLLVDFRLCALADDATRAYVIEVVKILCRVTLVVGGRLQGCRRLPLEAYIIIIGRGDYRHLALGIVEPSLLPVVKRRTLLINSEQSPLGPLTVVIELTVFRHSLAETHELYLADEQFYLIVGQVLCLEQQVPGIGILHTRNHDEGQVVESLGSAVGIAVSQAERLVGIALCGIEAAVVIGIRQIVKPVNLLPVSIRA